MKYIRMHQVEAEPMRFGEFKSKYPKSGGANVERGENDEGYVIFYRGGEYATLSITFDESKPESGSNGVSEFGASGIPKQ